MIMTYVRVMHVVLRFQQANLVSQAALQNTLLELSACIQESYTYNSFFHSMKFISMLIYK